MVALALGKSLFEQGSQRVGRPEPKKPTNLCDLRPRNEKRPAVDLSTPGVKSFGRQSSNSDESFPNRPLEGIFSECICFMILVQRGT